ASAAQLAAQVQQRAAQQAQLQHQQQHQALARPMSSSSGIIGIAQQQLGVTIPSVTRCSPVPTINQIQNPAAGLLLQVQQHQQQAQARQLVQQPPVAAAATAAAAAVAPGGQITPVMEATHQAMSPAYHNGFLHTLVRLCENSMDAPYVRRKDPACGANHNKAGEQHEDFTNLCFNSPPDSFKEVTPEERSQLDLLVARSSTLTHYCQALFPTQNMMSILYGEPDTWGFDVPTNLTSEMVHILAATIEYKKKLTEVKHLNDWFDLFKATKRPQDMYSAFVQHFASNGVPSMVEVASKIIERAIENVSLEWAEARMRLCDYYSRTIFGKEKMELAPTCAKAVLAEVDKMTALEPVQPRDQSIAIGRFVFALGDGPPRWEPFCENDRPLLVIPASQYIDSNRGGSSDDGEGDEPPFKRRRPGQTRTVIASSTDTPSTSGMQQQQQPPPPPNLNYHLPPGQMQALAQIQAAATEQARVAAAAATQEEQQQSVIVSPETARRPSPSATAAEVKEDPPPPPIEDAPDLSVDGEHRGGVEAPSSSNSSTSSQHNNHPFRLAPTSDSGVALPQSEEAATFAPASAARRVIPWMENGIQKMLSVEEVLMKEKHIEQREEWNLLEGIIQTYLVNKRETMRMVEITKPDTVSREVIWNRMQYEVALRRHICNLVERKYFASLKGLSKKLAAESDAAYDGAVSQDFLEAVMRTRHTFEDITMINSEVRTNACRIAIAILSKMFDTTSGGSSKTVGELYTEMDTADRDSLEQRSRMHDIRSHSRIRNGPYSPREMIKRWKMFEELTKSGHPAFDATSLSITFLKRPGELFGKCHILYDIVDAMKKHERFSQVTFSRRIHLALGMFYLGGHLETEPGKYSVNDLAKIDVTCDVLQQLFGTAATDPEDFHFSMSEVISAIKMDKEIQSIMNQIMIEELHIDGAMIAARRERMQQQQQTQTPPTPSCSREHDKEVKDQSNQEVAVAD
ncbi:hypothetical protein PENTCL1PPCAC_29209, partial [Pristionchus entomophagus]